MVVRFPLCTFGHEAEQDDEIDHINLRDSGKALVFRGGAANPVHRMRTDVQEPLLIAAFVGALVDLKWSRTFLDLSVKPPQIDRNAWIGRPISRHLEGVK